MSAIIRFEDIQAWQKAKLLVRRIYEVTREGIFAKDFALRDQLRRAAISMMSNIAEGFARRTSKEFANFLNMAHGSAAEVQSQLYIARDLGYITETRFHELYQLAEEVSKMVQGFIDYLKTNSQLSTHNSQLKGRK